LLGSLIATIQLLSDVGAELSFQLPLTASPAFPELFAKLEAESVSLGVETYGISVTTLEEVFMKVAKLT
jgi:ATP-binding cassette subfamily A (ABC1) protein 3